MGNILVTGGAGFIGSHLCEFLLQKGHSVVCMDNLITGKKSNVSRLLGNKKFSFANHDVSRHISVEKELDWVLHFASPASPVDYQKIPIQTLKAGSLGTHNTLGLALAKEAKYLLASTSEVYGDPLVNPQPESYWGNVNPIGVRGCYDESKRFAEALTMAYHRIHNVDIRIVRIFNTYGPRMRIDDGRAVPNFINQALHGKDITVYGDGSQTRSFGYISDLVDGIYRLMNSGINEPVNIGNPEEFAIFDFAKLVKEIAGSKSRIIFAKMPEDDPKVRRPDISKAVKDLGWKPKVDIKTGIRKTIEYFKES